MTRRQRRAVLLVGCLAIVGVAVGLVLTALRDTIVFFHTPSAVAEKSLQPGQRFRLGGLVAEGSLKRGIGTDVEFAVTDTAKTISVSYRGVLPDLFREGQGVVAEGMLDAAGRFRADTVLAKHDETYMPPEVAKALKEQGVWQGEAKAKEQCTEMIFIRTDAGSPPTPSPSQRGGGGLVCGSWRWAKVEMADIYPIVPSPLVGEGQGGGDSRDADVCTSSRSQTMSTGSPPTPNPSPRGGLGSCLWICPMHGPTP